MSKKALSSIYCFAESLLLNANAKAFIQLASQLNMIMTDPLKDDLTLGVPHLPGLYFIDLPQKSESEIKTE
jgi:hypothetical protein